MFSYVGKSSKVLQMQRIFVQAVDKSIEESHGENTQESECKTKSNKNNENQKYIVEKTYSEALNQLLEPGELPPRKLQSFDYSIPGEEAVTDDVDGDADYVPS